MWQRDPTVRRPSFGGFGSGPPPRDILVLIGVLFVTFSMTHFAATRGLMELFWLSPAVWQAGFLWQLVTYPFVGIGNASVWILLELLILYWFASDVYGLLGRRRFWRHLIGVSFAAAVVAVLVQLIFGGLSPPLGPPFMLMQGQRILMAIVIAIFATLRADASILLFFVLPIRAGYFLWLELLFAFIAYLNNKDLAGMAGIFVAVGLSWYLLAGRSKGGRGGGGLREIRLRLERFMIERKLARLRKKSGMRVVPGGKSSNPFDVN